MGCIRKRGNSWNAQVRISGWRSFTKTFKTKLDITEWVFNFEKELRSKPIPEKNIKSLKENSIDLYSSTKSIYLQNKERKIKNSDVVEDDDWGNLDK